MMKHRDLTVFLTLGSLLASTLISFTEQSCKDNFFFAPKRNELLISSPAKIKNQIDTMKVRDVIILAKYAQGGIVLNSFLEYLRHMKVEERRIFLSQIVDLIKKLGPFDSDAEIAIKKSGLSSSCRLTLILGKTVTDQKLEELLRFQDEDLEGTFKVLLNLFSEGYKRAYAKNRNNASKFWYWDYSTPAISFQVVELDGKQEVDITNF